MFTFNGNIDTSPVELGVWTAALAAALGRNHWTQKEDAVAVSATIADRAVEEYRKRCNR